MIGKSRLKPVSATLASSVIGNFTDVKTYLGVDSYDAVAIVLVVASDRASRRGMTEAEIAEAVGIPRSTINRMLARLLDTKHLVLIDGKKPKRYGYNYEYAEIAHGEAAEPRRHQLAFKLVNRHLAILQSVLEMLVVDQSEQEK